MNQNNPDPLNQPIQWLSRVYEQEYTASKLYIVSRIHNAQEADDLLGNSFFKLAKVIRHDPDSFPDPANVKALLYTIIKNDCTSWLRQTKPKNVGEPVEDIADDHQAVAIFEKRDSLRLMQSIIDELSGQLKQVAHLTLMEGYSLDEIARHMNLEKDVVSVYKTRAIRQLRNKVLAQKHKFSPGEFLLLLSWLYAFT